MNQNISRLLKCAGIGVAVVPLSILTHELGHFAAYHLLGAGNIRLHSASVSADKEMLAAGQIAVANIVGPIITYITIAIALVVTKRRYSLFWVMLALAAPIGRIVNVIYAYFRLLGYHPKPNFDEFNFATNLGVDPLLIVVPTILAVAATFVYFGRLSWAKGGWRELLAIAIGLIAGVAVWFTVGPVILP